MSSLHLLPFEVASRSRQGAQAPPAPPAPPALQAPQTPQAPQAPVPPPPSSDELRAQIREQIRKSIEDAKQAARDAKVAAQQAKHPELPAPVLAPGSGTIQAPFDPATIQPMVENVATYFFFSLVTIVLGVAIVRVIGRRLGPAPAPPAIPPQLSEQLQRIEHAVEAMAIEVERISESQRFLTKLQAGKGEPAMLPPRQGT